MTDADLHLPPVRPVPSNATRPRRSVMVPAYNAASTIRQTLESVLAHGYLPSDMQIAVVDNASTDATADVVNQLAEQAGVAWWAVNNWERAGDTAARRTNYARWTGLATPGQRLDLALAQAKEYGVGAERRMRRRWKPLIGRG